MNRVLPLLVSLLAGSAGWCAAPAAPRVTFQKQKDRVQVQIGGELFTAYVFGDGASRPYCYPVLAADGTPLTRDFPQKETPGEERDHPWHRSILFEHSWINGVDFWNEGTGDISRSPKEKGRTINDGAVETKDGAVGVLRARNRYVAPDGRLICRDERTLRFGPAPDGRYIDYEITLQALPDQPLVFGDNKDGTMAIRLAQWMTMPHKYQKKDSGGNGHIVTAKGVRDGKAWGTRADWCDYYAKHNGKTYGVAIFDHPQNLRHPTWWMARDYGLFGANPFGWHDFESEFKDQPHKGDHTVPAGGTLTLKYRLYFHSGDAEAAKLAQRYTEYAAGK